MASQGAPKIIFKEQLLGEAIPSFVGVTGVVIMDAEKGETNTPIFVSSELQLTEKLGKPNPKKFGLGFFSASNFLKENNKLWVIRVDKNQKFASSLVRTAINPITDHDEYGYVMENPVVDQIVKPLGSLSKEQIAAYQFQQYPTTRKVVEFAPTISLIDKPETGDTRLLINNSAPISIGDVVTLKDTTGMSREDTLSYKTYTVIKKSVEPVRFEYVTVSSPLTGISLNTRVQKVNTYYVDTSSLLVKAGNINDQKLYVNVVVPAQLSAGKLLDLGLPANYTVASLGNEDLIEDFTTVITGTATPGSTQIVVDSVIPALVSSTRVNFNGSTLNVTGVNANTNTINLENPLVGLFDISTTVPNVSGSAYQAMLTLDPSVDNTSTVSVNIAGSVFTATGTGGASTVADLLAEFATAINASTVVTAVVSGANIIINGRNEGPVAITDLVLTSVTPTSVGAVSVAQQTTVTVNSVKNFTQYRLLVGSDVITFNSGSSATAASIVNGLVAAVTSGMSVVASNVSGNLVLTSKTPGTSFACTSQLVSVVKAINNYPVINLVEPLTASLPVNTLVKEVVTQVADYTTVVYTREVVPNANNRVLRVSNNDPIAEGDIISVNGDRFTIVSKYVTENNTHVIELDSTYLDQTTARIGDTLFKVALGDYEHRDAFLVTASSPGDWGNRIAITVRDSKDYKEAFWVDVYYDGAQVESWEVTREYMKDGYGRQMNIEEKINNQSTYIRVYNNEFMVDEDGKYVEPLKTLYYIAQPVKTTNYTTVAHTAETVWDTDNVIRVRPEDILNIDINKPIQIAGTVYSIARRDSSMVGGPEDTIILTTGMSLNMGDLLPMDRKLPIGTELKQYFDRAKRVEVTIENNTAGAFTVKVRNTTTVTDEKTYTYTAVVGDTTATIAANLATIINPDRRVNATSVDDKLILVSQYDGIDFDITITSNMRGVVVQTVARQFTHHPVAKVNGTILPTVNLNSEVSLSDGRYIIRDAGANRFIGGDDNGYPTTGNYLLAAEQLSEANTLDFLVAMDGGITDPYFQRRLVEICEKRQDSVAFLSIDYNSQFRIDGPAGALAWRSNLNINSSFAAAYAPWTQTYDMYNDLPVWTSPESWAGRAAGYVSNNGELWYAFAGSTNAKVTANKLAKVYNNGELDMLYDNQVNPIRFVPNVGMNIGGQKTLQAGPGPTSRINVRIVCIVIMRGLKEYYSRNEFRFNDESTRSKYETEGRAFLQDIKIRGGLYDYIVYCNRSNNTDTVIDNNEIYIDVGIQPTKVAEYIINRLTITRTGSNFSEIRL